MARLGNSGRTRFVLAFVLSYAGLGVAWSFAIWNLVTASAAGIRTDAGPLVLSVVSGVVFAILQRLVFGFLVDLKVPERTANRIENGSFCFAIAYLALVLYVNLAIHGSHINIA